MKTPWSGLRLNPEKGKEPNGLAGWMGEEDPAAEYREDKPEDNGQTEFYTDNRPIEPEQRKPSRPSIFKWVIFVLLIGYTLLSYYHAPILSRIGSYLVVEHPLKKADLIVCLMGSSVERGLAAAEVYKRGLGAGVFFGREEFPEGTEVLKQRGIHFPESRDLLKMMLQGLGVPGTACLTSERFVGNTYEEAQEVRAFAQERGYSSLIVVTSPIHTRRAWLTYKKVFEKDDVKIMMLPSRYTNFKSDGWWKTRKYLKEVAIEYQKLAYYTVKYFL
jgi:uncharacterized SAM-binding protein YcdF (DUF218 family)